MVNYRIIRLKRGRHEPLRNGGYSFLTKPEKAIRKNRKYIRAYLQEGRHGAIRDHAGDEGIRAGRR